MGTRINKNPHLRESFWSPFSQKWCILKMLNQSMIQLYTKKHRQDTTQKVVFVEKHTEHRRGRRPERFFNTSKT